MISNAIQTKIKTREEINKIAQALHKEGKKIVTTNGSFDMLHYGHVYCLEEAKKQGDILIVGLNSDHSIHIYKSSDRPIIPEKYRAAMLAALSCVDYVTVFDETVPMPFLEGIKPHIHANSAEYGADCVERPTVEKYGGKVYVIPKVEGLSTSAIMNKLLAVTAKEKGQQTWRDKLLATVKKQNGILFAEPAIVYRCQYSGRNIIAKNSKFAEGYVDERGYVPVEWWIMSKTPAGNEKKKEGEGLSLVYLETEKGTEKISFQHAVEIATADIVGEFTNQWPLTKILDIGGEPVQPSFGNEKEIPPIPCHVHSGDIINGKAAGPGKLEAYFFPPVNVQPYNAQFGKTITRLGVNPNVSKEMFEEKLKHFGKDDAMYELCTVYEIKAYDGWTLLPSVVHAPGPWTTFEIQRPQDDFNLASWQLGQRFREEELEEKRQSLQFRGLKDEKAFVEEVVNWDVSIDPKFKEKWYRPSKVIEQGSWGRRLQIFFDAFYGEALEIQPGQSYTRIKDERPFAGIVWSGKGMLNGNEINVMNNARKEFLVTPKTEVIIKNTGTIPLLIYTVFPIDEKKM